MAGRSSISSFSPSHTGLRWLLPLLGLLAVVLTVDRVLWGSLGPWDWMDLALADCGARCRVIRNKTHSEVELAGLRSAEPNRWRVVVAGSSRAGAGFMPQMLPEHDPVLATLHLAKVAIASTEPYTMRSLASRLHAGKVDEVVLYLSEFDTHRPPYLVPAVGFGGFGAWTDLVHFAGLRFSWRHRNALMRLAAASMLNTYRHRDVLHALGHNYARLPRRDGSKDATALEQAAFDIFSNALIVQPPPDAILPWDDFQRVSDEIRTHFAEPVTRGPFRQLRTISFGRHVALQKALVEATVGVLIARDIRVLIVEVPLHPLAALLYDLATRDDFRAFADELALDPRIDMLELTQLPPFREDEFNDLTHLNAVGAVRHTRIIVDRLARHAQAASRVARP